MRLRSANRGNSYNTWNVNTSGNVNNNNAANSNRFSPIAIICVAFSICLAGVAVLLPITRSLRALPFKGETIPRQKPDKKICRATRRTYEPCVRYPRPGDNMNKEEIISFEQLYESMEKCKKGVIWKPSVTSYYLNAIERTLQLERQLTGGSYKARPPRPIKITYPKKRDGLSIAFRDRVYQRSLNDNEVYPALTKSFIYDNCACQKGKGTDLARGRLKRHLRKFYAHYGNGGYVLQIDINGYYPNMRHDVVKRKFKKHLAPDTYAIAAKILDEQYAGDVGYNPGSQMVQIAGISVLDELDHYIKERLHAKFYLRYMDDFLIIHYDKNSLKAWLEIIKEQLDTLGFSVSAKKTTIKAVKSGFDFLGFTYRMISTGKIIMTAKPERVKHERYKLRKMARLVAKGKMTAAKYNECYASWRNHINKGNSYKLLLKMDKYQREVLLYEMRKNCDQCSKRTRRDEPDCSTR